MIRFIKCMILVSRPKGWKAYFWMGMLGLFQGEPNLRAAIVAVYSLASYLATAFAVNNLFDAASDALNPCKNNPLNKGCGKSAVYAVIANQVLALLLVAVNTPINVFLIYLAATLLVVAYSAPPIRLKGIAGLDLLSHIFYFGILLFLYGVLLSNIEMAPPVLAKASVIGIYSAFLQMRNMEKDKVYDERGGDETLSVKYPGLSRVLLYLSGAASATGAVLLLSPSLTAILSVLLVSLLAGYWLGWERLVDSLTVLSLSLSVVRLL